MQISADEQFTYPQHIIEKIEISPRDVQDILETLDTSKAVGPDGVNPKLLREASSELAEPLSKVFNLSLLLKIFPEQWKVANIVPVFKKDDPKSVNNYRPISLLSVISKVFEKCVYRYLHNFIVENNLLSQHQSGFRKGDSTVNQLLFITHEFSKALDASNILLNESETDPEKQLTLIDLEYCSYNYRGFDFGNHFCEWTYNYTEEKFPNFTCKPECYPSKEEQYQFFRDYLTEKRRLRNDRSEITEDELLTLYKEATVCAVASHYLWGIWSIVQLEICNIEFGYLVSIINRFILKINSFMISFLHFVSDTAQPNEAVETRKI
ncbi:hypothetical protein FSP39_018306 [Pinctada imbricata]|uniref:Reverse transcriptase domain-containing protein n=1 Tax=Pinctada imbricata TaxID=66713 RepID=A0AA88YEA4_PINIB|nr:hypothetical protein FSP39_018306 [Pinctada imbricata]